MEFVLSKHPAPKNRETGEQLWERGIRLQGNQRALVESRARFKQGRGGIRAGKSFIGAVAIYLDQLWRELECGALEDLYWIVGPTYDLATEEMRHLSRLLRDGGIPHILNTPVNQSWTIKFHHKATVIETRTSGEAERLAARAPRGIVLAEAGQQAYAAFVNSRLRVSETRGWVLLEGTFEQSQPWYYQLAEEWSKPGAMGETFPMPSWENLVVYPGGRMDPEILSAERDLSPAAFGEKFGGEAQRRSDLVMAYAEERWHVKHRYPFLKTSFDPDQPVTLFADPGTAHAYAVFAVQFWEQVTWVIDAVYRWGRTAEAIIEECSGKEWTRNVEQMVMDFAGRQQNSNGPSNVEQWAKGWREKVGAQLWVHAEPVPLAGGYDIHRRALLNAWPEEVAQNEWNRDRKLVRVTDPDGPRLMIDPAAAAPLFGGYVDGQRYLGEYNLHRQRKGRDGTVLRDDPVDTDNDAIKAISYGLYWRYGAHGDRARWANDRQAIGWEMVLR